MNQPLKLRIDAIIKTFMANWEEHDKRHTTLLEKYYECDITKEEKHELKYLQMRRSLCRKNNKQQPTG